MSSGNESQKRKRKREQQEQRKQRKQLPMEESDHVVSLMNPNDAAPHRLRLIRKLRQVLGGEMGISTAFVEFIIDYWDTSLQYLLVINNEIDYPHDENNTNLVDPFVIRTFESEHEVKASLATIIPPGRLYRDLSSLESLERYRLHIHPFCTFPVQKHLFPKGGEELRFTSAGETFYVDATSFASSLSNGKLPGSFIRCFILTEGAKRRIMTNESLQRQVCDDLKQLIISTFQTQFGFMTTNPDDHDGSHSFRVFTNKVGFPQMYWFEKSFQYVCSQMTVETSEVVKPTDPYIPIFTTSKLVSRLCAYLHHPVSLDTFTFHKPYYYTNKYIATYRFPFLNRRDLYQMTQYYDFKCREHRQHHCTDKTHPQPSDDAFVSPCFHIIATDKSLPLSAL